MREAKRSVDRILLKGPVAAGYRTDLWTCSRVSAVVHKRFGVSYHPAHMGRVLHDLGFSPQKPRRVAREQDPEAVEQWRRQDWPNLKKKPADVVPVLFLSMKPGFNFSR